METERLFSLPVPHVHVRLEATPEAADLACEGLVAFVVENGGGAELAERAALAVAEAVRRVARHAHLDGDGWIDCEADIDEGLLEVVVADRSGEGAGIEMWMRFALD